MGKICFSNGTVLTMEDELYARSVLVEDGIITAVGNREEFSKEMMAGAKQVDLAGKTLMPAFIDSHSHFSACANSLLQAPLDEAVSFGEIQEEIRSFIERKKIPKGQWVLAKGYDHNLLKEGTYPDRSVLDEAALENPLVIQHKSGHVGVFNTMALKELGVTEHTQAPQGGMIEIRDGKLTGYMEENAFIRYIKEVPMPPIESLMDAYRRTQEIYASYGITTIQEGMMENLLVPLYRKILEEDLLKLDLVAFPDMKRRREILEQFPESIGAYDRHLKLGGYKIFLDGSPQSRTAWMRKPYQGEAAYRGYGTMTDDEVYRAVTDAVKENRQLLAHCNGDAACEQYICACEKAVTDGYRVEKIRPVMIHAQFLGADQMDRVKAAGIIPSFFVGHVYYWGDAHLCNFGLERTEHLSPAKSASEKGILFTLHQDAPVTRPDMTETLWCAVNRVTKAGAVLGREERIDVLEGLKALTINGAYQYFEEEEKGSIKVGKRADFVVLDRNPLEIERERIREIKVAETYKDGEKVFG